MITTLPYSGPIQEIDYRNYEEWLEVYKKYQTNRGVYVGAKKEEKLRFQWREDNAIHSFHKREGLLV